MNDSYCVLIYVIGAQIIKKKFTNEQIHTHKARHYHGNLQFTRGKWCPSMMILVIPMTALFGRIIPVILQSLRQVLHPTACHYITAPPSVAHVSL